MPQPPAKEKTEKEYSFTPEPRLDPNTNKVIRITDKPYIVVYISNLTGTKLNTLPVQCLIDSGADINLFPAEWGETIGINIKSGEFLPIRGIGNHVIDTWRHEICIHVGQKTDFTFMTHANFSYDQRPPLLGMDGFFNLFDSVTFDEVNRCVRVVK